MLTVALGLLIQVAVALPDPGTVSVGMNTDSVLAPTRSLLLAAPKWDPTRLYEAMADTGKRRLQAIEYSDTYHNRVTIHRVLSFAMLPLFVGSGYTGFQLRNKGDNAPKWTRDLHGPLAAGTAVVFGMNTLTGAWNLWEGRKDPDGRGKRLLHGALSIAAAAGFTYVIAAGDNIRSTGKGNSWHRNIALASMSISVVSWSLMIFR